MRNKIYLAILFASMFCGKSILAGGEKGRYALTILYSNNLTFNSQSNYSEFEQLRNNLETTIKEKLDLVFTEAHESQKPFFDEKYPDGFKLSSFPQRQFTNLKYYKEKLSEDDVREEIEKLGLVKFKIEIGGNNRGFAYYYQLNKFEPDTKVHIQIPVKFSFPEDVKKDELDIDSYTLKRQIHNVMSFCDVPYLPTTITQNPFAKMDLSEKLKNTFEAKIVNIYFMQLDVEGVPTGIIHKIDLIKAGEAKEKTEEIKEAKEKEDMEKVKKLEEEKKEIEKKIVIGWMDWIRSFLPWWLGGKKLAS